MPQASDDPELDRVQQQGTVAGRRVVMALALPTALALTVGGINRAQFGSGHFHLQNPFDLPPYNSLDSLVGRYWFYGLLVTGAVVAAAARISAPPLGLRVVGGLALAVAGLLATVPISGYPEQGPGTCKAVISGLGTYGDNDEVCYDVRSTRAGDVGILVGAGTVLLVLATLLQPSVAAETRS